MKITEEMKMTRKMTRRDFVRGGASASIAALASAPMVYATQNEPTLKVGLIGCGGRGTGAADNCMESSKNVQLIAMGDMFKDRLDNCRKQMSKHEGYKVQDDHVFTGFDAYKKVLDTGIDMVILATPPGFRPLHFAAAIDAGKHVFFEKPVAVDPVGIRKVMEYGKKAKEKKLAVVTGTQRRHEAQYIETIKRIHDGAIGDIVAARAYWNGSTPWVKPRQPGQSDMEYQLRNWYFFAWLCGDHIVEQHVHNLDVMNWVLRGHPEKAVAVGGRSQRTGPEFGNAWDNFGVDFTWPNDVHVLSMCRHWSGCPGNVSEAVVGTKGKSNCSNTIDGQNKWRFDGKNNKPYVQEHTDLIASIRNGNPLNEAQQVAESTLTAIMGREAAYTGQEIKWNEFLNSDLDLTPPKYEFGELAELPTPVPGAKGGKKK